MLRTRGIVFKDVSKRWYSSANADRKPAFNVMSFLDRIDKLYDGTKGRNKLQAAKEPSKLASKQKNTVVKGFWGPQMKKDDRSSRSYNSSGKAGGGPRPARNEPWKRRVENLTSLRDSSRVVGSDRALAQNSLGNNRVVSGAESGKKPVDAKWTELDDEIGSLINTPKEKLDLYISTGHRQVRPSDDKRSATRGSRSTRNSAAANPPGSSKPSLQRFSRLSRGRGPTANRRQTNRTSRGTSGQVQVNRGISAATALAKLKNLRDDGFTKVWVLKASEIASSLPHSAVTYNTRVLSAVCQIKLLRRKQRSDEAIHTIVGKSIRGDDNVSVKPESQDVSSAALANALNSNMSLSKESRLLIMQVGAGKKPLSQLRN